MPFTARLAPKALVKFSTLIIDQCVCLPPHVKANRELQVHENVNLAIFKFRQAEGKMFKKGVEGGAEANGMGVWMFKILWVDEG